MYAGNADYNLPPVFTQDMNNHVLSESTPVGTIVYKLEGYDPEGGEISFGLIGSDHFEVDPKSGNVKVIKPLDTEVSGPELFFFSFLFHSWSHKKGKKTPSTCNILCQPFSF